MEGVDRSQPAGLPADFQLANSHNHRTILKINLSLQVHIYNVLLIVSLENSNIGAIQQCWGSEKAAIDTK